MVLTSITNLFFCRQITWGHCVYFFQLLLWPKREAAVLVIMDPGQFETPWVEYTKRMDPDKYVKFAQCFHQLIQGTNLKEANSMLSIGIGQFDRNDWFK